MSDIQAQTRDERLDTIVTIFNEKLEHINNTLSSILTKLDKNDDEYKSFLIELTNLKNKDQEQQKEIDELKKSNEENKKWWLGVISAVSVAIIIYLLKIMGLGI